MNICMLTWEYPPRIVGGIARHCFGLTRALARKGHSVHVVTLDFPGAPQYEESEGVKIYRAPVELGHPNFIVWVLIFNHFLEKRVAFLSRDLRFDIIHAHDWLVAPVGIASKHYLKAPLVSTVHSIEAGRARGIHSPDSRLIDGVEWWMTYESKRIIAVSNSAKREIEGHFHLPGEKIDVIPNAVDASKYNISVDREFVKRRFGIAPHERLVLFIGRLAPQKGVEYLIRATPQIIRVNPDARIVIVGAGWL
ncbi:glycosyltransferase family 4 protein, partial [Candidatus Bathyarchaeota archaeon]|nr:glycosyltransferase family 4 protein [Candidatus Bathyarchaeota archaeon]